MNHIYKSIFNKALGVFTAVPEFASAHGKGSERTVVGRVAKGTAGFAASALAISLGLALTSTSAVGYAGIYVNDRQAGNCLAINDAAISNLGVGTILDVNTTPGSVELKVPGTWATQTGITPSYYNAAGSARPCTAVGGSVVDNRETQTNRTLFYGGAGAATQADEVNDENNGAKNLTLGGRLDVNSGIIGVGDRGVNGNGATNSIRMGMGTALSDANKQVDAITIGVNAGASAKHATAIGSATTAKTGYSTALGFQSQAGDPAVTNFNGEYATAIGGKAKALHAYTTALGAETNASGAYATAVGNEAKATHESTTAVGKGAKATNDFATAVGQLALASGKNGTAVGTRNEALGEEATAIGYHSHANGSQQLSIGAHAGRNLDGSFSQSTHGISIGSLAGADNATAKSNDDSVLIGTESGRYAQGGNRNTSIGKSAGQYLKGNDNIAMGSNAGSGTATDKLEVSNTVAIGNTAKASGNDGIALGNTANSKTDGAISIGTRSVSGDGDAVPGVTPIGNKSISIGYESVANRYDTIAMGVESSTQAADPAVAPWDAVAIGSKSKATTYKALAIGAYSQATGRQSTVIGNDIQGQNSTASGTRSQILGVQSNVSGDNSVSIGDTNTVASARTYAMGNNINAAAGTDDSLAFGTRAHVSGANQVSIGKDAGADAAVPNTSGIVIGESAGRYLEGGTRNTAIGERAGQYVKGSYNIAMGTNAGSRTATDTLVVDDSTSIGHNAKAVTSESIAIGKNAESGKVDKFDGKKATAIGHEAKALGTGNIAMGAYATSENGHDGVAIGTYVKSSNVKAIAIGAYSSASGVQSIAIANNYNSDNSYASNKSTATGVRAIVMGAESHATAERALAIGDKNTVASARTYAIGNNINVAAGADDSLVFGTRAAVGAENTVAIGANANAAQANSVALGAGSATSDVNTGDYTLNTSYTAAGQPVAANGTVSVGSAGKERQIQNVAAGVISATSTDAINGSQLYATNNYMNNFAGDVKTKLGGNAALGNDGHLTMTNIGGTGKDNVNDAIAAANTKVAAGENITVNPTTNADGSKTYTVATKKDLVVNSVTAGDSTLNTNGLAITDGPSVLKTGINAGDKVISGVADGNIAAGSKEAVNGGQLAEVKSKADSAVQNVVSANPTALTATKAGDTVTLTPNFIAGDLVNPATGAVNTPAAGDAGKLVTAGTVANALANTHFVVDTAKTDGELDAASKHDQKIKSGNKVTLQAGKNLKAKQTNAADGATVEFSLKDSISLTQVTAGTGANQVVLGNDGVKVGGNTYINNDGLNANSKVISNVAAGVKPTDAVNKGQLDAVKNVADSAVQSVDVAANENNLVVDNNDPKNPKLRLRKAVDLDSIKLENNVGEKSFLNSAGLTIEGGPAVTRSGINANNTKVTNVTDGDVNGTSKDAVNGSQLYNVASNVKDLIGPDAAIDPATGKVTVADPTKGIGETGKGNIGDAIKAVNKAATAAKTTVKEGDNITVTPTTNTDGSTTYTVATKKDLDVTSVTAGNTTVNTNGLTITGGPSVTRGGIDAGNAVITNVRDGKVEANSKDAVNGGQLHATNTKLDGVKAKADTAVQDVKSGDENALTAVKDPSTNIVTVTPKLSGDLVDANGNITAPTTPADKGKLVTAGTVADALANTHFVVDTKATDGELDAASQADQKIKAGNKVTLQAGKNLKAKQTNAADGAQVEFSLKDSISLTEVTAGTGDNQVVLGNNGVQVGGNTYINKDGLNANSKVISNVADGVKPTDAVNKGQLDAVKGVADSAVKSVDVANGEQNLVVDNTDAKNPKLSLKKDLTLDSVTAGDSKLATDGLTIAGGPSVKKDGINAGDKTITNVAPGAVTAASKDAVNGSQLYNVANNVKDLIGPDATIDPATGKVTVADLAKGIGETGKGTIGEAIKSVKDKADTAVQDIKSGDEKALSVTKAGNTYTITPKLSGDLVDADGNITAPATDADKGKLVTAGTVAQALANTHFVVDTKATDGELDSASEADQKVKAGNKVTLQAGKNLKAKQTNGANGAEVEFSLKDSISLKEVKVGEGSVNEVVLNDKGVNVAGKTYINKDGLNANGNKITNVKAGDVSETSTDAVNGGQLHSVASSVANVLGGKATVDGNGNVTSSDIGGTGQNTVHDAIAAVNKSATAAKTKVVNGKNITVDPVVNSDGSTTYTISTAENLDVTSVTAGDSTLNNDGLTINNGPSMTKAGINANNTKVTNVADGVSPTDAVNKGQLDNVTKNVAELVGPDVTIDSATGKVTLTDPAKGIAGTGKTTIGEAIQSAAAAANTKVAAGDNITVTPTDNSDGSKTYTVSTAKNLNVDSVKAGNTTINNNGIEIVDGPKMTKGGINMGGKAITNVANGNVAADSKDAVNGGQLHETAKSVADVIGGGATVKDGKVVAGQNGIGNTGQNTVHGAIAAINQNTANNFNQIRGDLRKMDRDLRGGIAGALATAGLPQAFRPGKSMVAAAASTYRGQSGLAIGVSRISDNGKVILKVTGNTNSRGDFGGTIGAGYQW